MARVSRHLDFADKWAIKALGFCARFILSRLGGALTRRYFLTCGLISVRWFSSECRVCVNCLDSIFEECQEGFGFTMAGWD